MERGRVTRRAARGTPPRGEETTTGRLRRRDPVEAQARQAQRWEVPAPGGEAASHAPRAARDRHRSRGRSPPADRRATWAARARVRRAARRCRCDRLPPAVRLRRGTATTVPRRRRRTGRHRSIEPTPIARCNTDLPRPSSAARRRSRPAPSAPRRHRGHTVFPLVDTPSAPRVTAILPTGRSSAPAGPARSRRGIRVNTFGRGGPAEPDAIVRRARVRAVGSGAAAPCDERAEPALIVGPKALRRCPPPENPARPSYGRRVHP